MPRVPALLLAAILTVSATGSSAAVETDLSVGWIARRPAIDYVWDSPDPTVEGWPEPGQRVTWVAHVRNLSGRRVPSVEYRWVLDGKVVKTGEAGLKAGGVSRFKLRQRWDRRRHELVFEIDPRNLVAEIEERNNRLLVHTDALAVGIWVEDTFWSSMRSVISEAGIGATTFDDWIQLRIRQYNEMAVLARYPETPRGVHDRWRIDAIRKVRDGMLPLSPPPEGENWAERYEQYGVQYPDSSNRTVDIQWGFPSYLSPIYADAPDSWSLLYDSFVHELAHARYLVDLYPLNLNDVHDVIEISPPPPTDEYGWYHKTREHGLMNTSWGYIDRYSAIALNRIAGHRATRGNYNTPENLGSYLTEDLPRKTRIRLVSPDGTVYPGRKVRLYRASSEWNPDWRHYAYQHRFDAVPDLELETNAKGAIVLRGNPFNDGDVVVRVERMNALAIVEVVDGATSRWGFLEARQLNLEFWRGQTRRAKIDLVLDQTVCLGGGGLGPYDVTPSHRALLDTREVEFKWPNSTLGGYELWYSIDGGEPKQVTVQPPLFADTVSTTLRLHGKHVAWWLVFLDPGMPPECPAKRSSIYFFDIAQ